MSDVGVAFASAIAEKDADALQGLLASDIDFKGLTPGQFWEGATPDEVAEICFGNWFDPDDHIESLLACHTGKVGDRESVTYRLRVTNSEGRHEVEQQVYFESGENGIRFVRVLCSGYMPVSPDVPG